MNPLPACLAFPLSVRAPRSSNRSASGRACWSRPRVASSASISPISPLALTVLSLALAIGCASVQAGSAEGYEAGRRGDYATALREFQPVAEKGDRDAQLALADMYLRGYGVAADPAIAARWFRKAAEQGDPRAQTNLGFLYEQGKGVARDF